MRNALSSLVTTFALGFALFTAGPSVAGVIIEFRDSGPGATPGSLSKAWIGADRVRVESAGQVMIYRGDKNVMWAVDSTNKTYMELTKGGIPGMAEAMKEMEAALADMPADERAMVEAMMKQQMGGAAAPKASAPAAPVTWKANGKSDKVAGHACTGYDGVRDGKVSERICAADWTALGLTRADFAAMEDLAEFMLDMVGGMTQMAGMNAMSGADVPGIPLRSVTVTPQGEHVHELTKIEKAAVDAAQFEVPAGFAKQSMDGSDQPERE